MCGQEKKTTQTQTKIHMPAQMDCNHSYPEIQTLTHKHKLEQTCSVPPGQFLGDPFREKGEQVTHADIQHPEKTMGQSDTLVFKFRRKPAVHAFCIRLLETSHATHQTNRHVKEGLERKRGWYFAGVLHARLWGYRALGGLNAKTTHLIPWSVMFQQPETLSRISWRE